MENIDEFIEMLQSNYNLDQKMVNELKFIKSAGGKEKQVNEFKVEDDFKSSYGYIVMVKNTNSNTVSCAFAIHSMYMKLAPRRTVSSKTRYFWFIPIGEDISYQEEPGTQGYKRD